MKTNFKLPKRSARFGVGKDIGGAVYVHRRYESRLGPVVAKAKKRIPSGFDYHIVKYDCRSGSVSFIQCFEFDSAPEPAVGQIICVSRDGALRGRKPPRDPEIYHHKWLMVANDYDGFNVEQSKCRSMEWLQLDNVDRRRIGRKSYWEGYVLPRLTSHSEA